MYLLGQSMSLLIVLQNLLARIAFIQLTKVIKFTSNTQRTRIIIVSVFLIYFLNYGVLYLLAPMNIEIPILKNYLIGIYNDFNQAWYSDIGGQITSVLVINAIFPPIEMFCLWALSFALRSFD